MFYYFPMHHIRRFTLFILILLKTDPQPCQKNSYLEVAVLA